MQVRELRTMPDRTSNSKHDRAKPLPQCKALLLCEDVFEDELSGQYSLHKLIEALEFSAFPGDSAAFAIFLQLYDGIGTYELSVELHDLAENTKAAMAFIMSLDFTERLARMDVILPVDSLRLPRPGRYELVVSLDGVELASQILDAEVVNGEKEE